MSVWIKANRAMATAITSMLPSRCYSAVSTPPPIHTHPPTQMVLRDHTAASHMYVRLSLAAYCAVSWLQANT